MLTWLQTYLAKPRRLVAGLMSGTSLDAIDVAIVEIEGAGLDLHAKLRHFREAPFQGDIRSRILLLCESGSAAEAARMNVELGELFATAILNTIEEAGLRPEDIDLIGSHGQTISHQPAVHATLQIGEPCIIAERTGIATVADFRPRDLAAGGDGAPLVPYVDYLLLRHAERHRIVQNIGGIANCTVLPAGCSLGEVRAWDTGPGNMVIDACVRALTHGREQRDVDGAMASRGTVDEKWLAALLVHPFLRRQPPKSAGREEFGLGYASDFVAEGLRRDLPDADVVATATAFTAASIAASYGAFAGPLLSGGNEPIEVILGGGGVFNPTLRDQLRQRLDGDRYILLTHEDLGLRSDAKEAIAFAILAHETVLGNPNNAPGATGARRPAVLGKFIPGRPR